MFFPTEDIPPDPREEQVNRHNSKIIYLILAALAVYFYFFTQAYSHLNIPSPESAAKAMGWKPSKVFDDDHNAHSSILIQITHKRSNDEERMIFFWFIGLTIIINYYLSIRHKRKWLLSSTLIAVGIFYGMKAVIGLAFGHTFLYLIFHPQRNGKSILPILLGLFGAIALIPSSSGWLLSFILTVGSVGLTPWIYRKCFLPLLSNPKQAKLIQTCGTHSAMICVAIGSMIEGASGWEWKTPLGIILFFWHWERVMMYHADLQDGQIPDNVSFIDYLSIFITPGQLGNWTWGVSIGQGYRYLEDRFLNKDKNILAVAGLKLWAIAFLYITLGNWIHSHLIHFLRDHDIHAYWRVKHMTCAFIEGKPMDAQIVLSTTLVDLIRWFFLFGGVTHFKTGVWRLCGYDVEPYFRFPWMATNLSNFWSRFTYHYREFLVRCFYYPIFFKFPQAPPWVRITLASFAAACFGNLIWGHMTESVFYHGMEWHDFTHHLKAWPYFFLLALGIAVSQIWSLYKKDKSRKSWTWDKKFPLDLFAAYVTWQYYALIHIFMNRCSHGSVWDHFQLFLIGLGLK